MARQNLLNINIAKKLIKKNKHYMMLSAKYNVIKQSSSFENVITITVKALAGDPHHILKKFYRKMDLILKQLSKCHLSLVN